MSVQLEVLFDSNKHQVNVKEENLDAVKQLLNANKGLLTFNKSILLELENNKLCSNGFMPLSTNPKTLKTFFDLLAAHVSNVVLTIDIVEDETNKGLLLRYKDGKIDKQEAY